MHNGQTIDILIKYCWHRSIILVSWTTVPTCYFAQSALQWNAVQCGLLQVRRCVSTEWDSAAQPHSFHMGTAGRPTMKTLDKENSQSNHDL